MSKEYIDKAALIEYLRSLGLGHDIGIVEDFPIADVMEVVRCKDCEYRGEPFYKIPAAHRCTRHDTYIYDMESCTEGVKKNDE